MLQLRRNPNVGVALIKGGLMMSCGATPAHPAVGAEEPLQRVWLDAQLVAHPPDGGRQGPYEEHGTMDRHTPRTGEAKLR